MCGMDSCADTVHVCTSQSVTTPAMCDIHQPRALQYNSVVTVNKAFRCQIVSQPGSVALSAVCDILSSRCCSTEAKSVRLARSSRSEVSLCQFPPTVLVRQ
jgi:hypothetical protein